MVLECIDATRMQHVLYSGLLLIVEKASIFGSDSLNQHNHASLLHNWKQAIQECGFRLEKYSTSSHTDKLLKSTSSKRSHIFAFRAIDVDNSETTKTVGLLSETDSNRSLSDWKMWIRQDFYNTDSSNGTTSASSEPHAEEGMRSETLLP